MLLVQDEPHFRQDHLDGVCVVRLTEDDEFFASRQTVGTELILMVQMSLIELTGVTVLMIVIAWNDVTCCIFHSVQGLLNHSGFHHHDGVLLGLQI